MLPILRYVMHLKVCLLESQSSAVPRARTSGVSSHGAVPGMEETQRSCKPPKYLGLGFMPGLMFVCLRKSTVNIFLFTGIYQPECKQLWLGAAALVLALAGLAWDARLR